MKFEWDSAKATNNVKKHGISFQEAQSVFFDEFAVQFFDTEHTSHEDRFLLLGMSDQSRLVLICHCERDSGETIRIISARKATKRECAFYGGK